MECLPGIPFFLHKQLLKLNSLIYCQILQGVLQRAKGKSLREGDILRSYKFIGR